MSDATPPNETTIPPPTRSAGGSVRYGIALVVVALGAAGFAIVFRGLLSLVFERAFRATDVVTMFRHLPPAARFSLPAVGGLCAGGIALWTARSKQGHGVGDVMEAVVLGRSNLSLRTTLLKSLGSWFAIVSGGSIGREGPLIQFGASFADWLGDVLRVDDTQARTLMAAGTAAGFTAAYNTPLAAVLFVLEVVTGIVALDTTLAIVFASALATTVTRAFAGGGPIYGQRSFAFASSPELIAHAALGLVAAIGAQAFMRLLSLGEAWFARSRIKQPLRAALGGLCVGALALRWPEVTGNGYEPLNAMLDGELPLKLVLALLVAKAFATTASVSSGSPGGVFTPSLFVGAALGFAFHHLVEPLFGRDYIAGPGAYALVGMAATIAATTHAPLMAAVLIFELSGDYAIVVPLLLATAVATWLSRVLRGESIYGAELRRRGLAFELTLDGRRILRTGTTPEPSAERSTRPPLG